MFNKNFKAIIIASALMTMTGMGEPTVAEASSFNGQTTANLNVRSGASTRYRVLTTLRRGSDVKVLSSSNGWYQVQYSDGKTGWSSAQYISKGGESSSTDSSSSQGGTPVSGNARTTVNLNVRSGASTRHSKITTLRKGTEVKLLSSLNGWYQVQYANGTGWCSAQYISTSNTPEIPETPDVSTPPATSNKQITVKAYAYTGGGTTATGTQARYGTLAVDPRVIPYGTKVYIKELNGVFIAEDCGGGIKGNKVDIYMNTTADCYNWGVRTITMEILN